MAIGCRDSGVRAVKKASPLPLFKTLTNKKSAIKMKLSEKLFAPEFLNERLHGSLN